MPQTVPPTVPPTVLLTVPLTVPPTVPGALALQGDVVAKVADHLVATYGIPKKYFLGTL